MASGVGMAFAIGVLGIGALGGLRFGADATASTVAVVALPWQAGGLGWAAAFGLPIVDLRGQGRVAVLDMTADPIAAQALWATQAIVLNADAVTGCLDLAVGTDQPGEWL